jgi:alkylhydroperoxidase family enzyme
VGYRALHESLVNTILQSPGQSAEALRRAVVERAQRPAGSAGAIPAKLTQYVDTVARHPYKVTDADIAGLKQAGYSDDVVFEITVAAAVGAAMHRLQRGMAALRGDEPD